MAPGRRATTEEIVELHGRCGGPPRQEREQLVAQLAQPREAGAVVATWAALLVPAAAVVLDRAGLLARAAAMALVRAAFLNRAAAVANTSF